MLVHPDLHAVLAADRADALRAGFAPMLRRPLRLRLGLRLVALGERLVRPYAAPRVTVAR